MFIKTVLFQIILIFSYSFLPAQAYNETSALHSFFRNNFDSTVIYSPWSNWDISPNYRIVAKKDTSIYHFTYKSPYRKVQERYPADLLSKFIKEEVKFSSTTPDTNRYFLPYYIYHRNKTSNWIQINSFGLWGLEEIEDSKGGCQIRDASYDTYYLITTNAIKVLTYYAADFYDTCKPENINRKNAIKTRDIILKVFGN
jgi:hypothetical protein